MNKLYPPAVQYILPLEIFSSIILRRSGLSFVDSETPGGKRKFKRNLDSTATLPSPPPVHSVIRRIKPQK